MDAVFNSPLEAANIIHAKRELGLTGGLLIANPVPEEYALSHEYIDKIIDDAVKECEEKGIKGKDITPFLLAKIAEVTGGKSLDTNIALVLNNAELGAKIAVEYANLKKSGAK